MAPAAVVAPAAVPPPFLGRPERVLCAWPKVSAFERLSANRARWSAEYQKRVAPTDKRYVQVITFAPVFLRIADVSHFARMLT